MKSIENRAAFDFVRYGNVWEDAEVLCKALGGGSKGQRLLSIASSGDNALALLTLDPKEVVAVDLNPAQLACLELRLAAFKELGYPELLAFLGVNPQLRRLETYLRLRKRLSPQALDFWDSRPALVSGGIIHGGKLEKFLRIYQWALRALVHAPQRHRELLLTPRTPSQRLAFYDEVWNTAAWRFLNRLAFSKKVLGRMGRDPEFFRHADGDVTSGPQLRLEKALSLAKTQDNPFLTYHLTGNFSSSALPMYLQSRNFKAIRRRSHRVSLFLGKAEEAPGCFQGFNLSNIFEYMDAQQHDKAYHKLLDKARCGGRLAYWNLHVSRPRPDSAKKRALPMAGLARRLHSRDRSWAYKSFHVDQVLAS